LLGIDKLAYFATRLGLGSRTGIDLPGEAPGLVPSPAWVQKALKRKWYAGETISVAIGQGAVTVTPLQVAYMIGGIASGGDYHRPHLVFKDQLLALGAAPDKPAQDFPLSPETVAAVKSGMWAVVNEGGGTGAGARCPEVEVSGKTGTAQVVSTQLQKSSANAEFKTNAWFVGYGPTDKPEIVVAALVLHGGHSTAAVPVVRDVIKAYFDKKAGPKPPANQMESQVRVLSQLQTVPAQVEAAPAKRR